MHNFSFQVTRQTTNGARTGLLTTPHGTIKTPAFVFCATKGSIKSVDYDRLEQCQTEIILSNTYHMMLRPGADAVAKAGGLHKFTGWYGPMMTDSGGFQIFSLGHGSVASEIKGSLQYPRNKSLIAITEEGAIFKSYIDGSIHKLTPESSIDIQRKLGADIILVLDECTPFHVDKQYTERAMHKSNRWAARSLNQFQKTSSDKQVLYGIIQGGIYEDLRLIGSEFINNQEFFGHAIGGSLGKTKEQMYDVVALTSSMLRKDRPIHLLGIGKVQDIITAVEYGIDTFDCVHPTRMARHGSALVLPSEDNNGQRVINLCNGGFYHDLRPIMQDCPCITCQKLSRAYIHHLIKAKEHSAHLAITTHNIAIMNMLMREIRDAITNDTIKTLRHRWLAE